MIKKMTAYILLAALAVLLLAGCTPERDKLVGRWETSLDLTRWLQEELEQSSITEQYAQLDDYKMTLVWIFYYDGTYSVTLDPAVLKRTEEKFYKAMEHAMTAYLEEEVAKLALNMTPAEYLQSLGLSMDSFMLQLLGEAPIARLAADLELEKRGCYLVEEGKLYLSESLQKEPGSDHLLYELHEDTLILEIGEWESDSQPFPVYDLYPAVLRRNAG